MKKINRKGFTLIELLAVIVIMGIILVITVPTVLESISNARVNSLHNLAVSTARNYMNIEVADLIAINKQLDGVAASNEWRCIGDLTYTQNGNTKRLTDILGLNGDDVVIVGEDPNKCYGGDYEDGDYICYVTNLPVDKRTGELNMRTIYYDSCSAIRRKSNGEVEILLVAQLGGKFAISGKTVYAFSSESEGHVK